MLAELGFKLTTPGFTALPNELPGFVKNKTQYLDEFEHGLVYMALNLIKLDYTNID